MTDNKNIFLGFFFNYIRINFHPLCLVKTSLGIFCAILLLFSSCDIAKAMQANDKTKMQASDEASYEAKIKKHDPLESMNRVIFTFNTAFDVMLIKPIVFAYTRVTPTIVQKGVSNFSNNLQEPLTLVNNVLSGEIKKGIKTFFRFMINSTIGLGGLLNPAEQKFKLERNKKTFSNTLRKWGMTSGPYLVLPFVGASSFVDAIGVGLDSFLDPYNKYMYNTNRTKYIYIRSGINAIEIRRNYKNVIDDIYKKHDPYVAMRILYLQNKKIIDVSDDIVLE